MSFYCICCLYPHGLHSLLDLEIKAIYLYLTSDAQTNTLQITNKYLRMISKEGSFNGSHIDVINTQLKYVQLLSCERLENRLLNEVSRTTSKYKTVKGGNNKMKFDKAVKKIAVFGEELKQCQPLSPITPSTPHTPSNTSATRPATPNTDSPSLINSGNRVDNSSSRHKSRLIGKLGTNASKALEFVETYGVLPKKLMCETFDGHDCSISLDGSETPYEQVMKIYSLLRKTKLGKFYTFAIVLSYQMPLTMN